MLKKLMFLTVAATTILTPVAFAGHAEDRFRPANRTIVIADELLDSTRHMTRSVEQRSHGRSRRSGDLLHALDRLKNQAREFRVDAVRGASPRRLDTRLERLFIAFDRVEREMRFVRSGHLQQEFDQIGRNMRALSRNVEIANGPRRGGERGRRGGVHGAIVLGGRNSNVNVRVRF